jgi:hypothetical protein
MMLTFLQTKPKVMVRNAPINFDRISDHVSLAQDILAAHQTPKTLTTLSILGSYVKCPLFFFFLIPPFSFLF